MTNDDYERPPTPEELILDIMEYDINNMSWGDIKTLLEEYYLDKLRSMPLEALESRYDSIFNR